MPALLVGLFVPLSASAAAFSGNARIEIGDSLSWNPSTAALTVSFWFKLAIPTGTNLTENMTILVNRRSGDEGNPHAYQVRFNIFTGNIEFTTRGTSGAYTNTLIERPYLERWYHVAVVRSADTFTGYLDGRPVFTATAAIGSSTSSDGASIGGWGSGKYLYGEVQEFAVHDSALSQEFIAQYMFANQPAIPELKGYYKLGYSTNAADNLRNFAPAGPGPGGVVGSGKVEFEESNQGGEQSAFDSRRNGGRDSLAPLSGAFSWEQTAFARPTPGIAFDFRFGYSSANAFGGFKLGGTDPYASGPLGAGWRHTFETRVLPSRTFSPLSDTDTVGLMMWNGAIETWDFDYDTGNYRTRSKEYKGELTFPTLSTCQWTTPERIVYTFKAPDRGNNLVMRGRLISIRDFNTNTVELRWNETIGVITQIVDTARGVYDFSYNAQQLLSTVAFANGPSVWLMNFGFDATNRVISQSFANTSGLYTNVNTQWQFAYNTNGLLERIIDPRLLTNSTVQYDQYGRKTNQVDALGRATVTKFGSPGKRQITHVDPGTNSWVETYDRKHRLLSQADPLGQTTSYTYDAAGNRLSITEPLGYITYFGYDGRANVIAKTNAAGEVSRWSFHPLFNKATNDVNPLGWTNYFVYDDARGNLLRHYDGLGTLVTYAYETNGLVLVAADANGNTSRFKYNTNGFLIAKTDPSTNTTSFTLNEVAWKLAETNALGQVATFAYDLNGRAVLAVDLLLRRFTNVFDANGNLLSANDGKGQLTRTFYDAANQKTQTVDRAGFTNLFFYTTRGKLDRATDALGNSATNFYDSANRLIRVSDPLGNTLTNTYDANGNLIAFVDQVGQRFTKSYDRLNRVIAESDPLGNTRRTTFDPAGRVSQVLAPNGYPSTHTYDGRGRLTQWVDAENFRWFYDYDPVGNITNITDALAGHYVMTYGSRNERLSELNQDNKLWTYAYDPLLRLTRQADPNGTNRNFSYDVAGRVLSVGFSTGRTNAFNYDLNNNPTNISRLQPGTQPTFTRFAYDILDRATNQVDALGQTVGYAYDALGRMTSLVYPGGKAVTHRYDALGRLTNQVDWAGRPMNYAYDRAGRLVNRTYPNGVTQTNTFDTAGRLTSLSYLTNSTAMIALTYAYDRNGNKNSMGEKGTIAWPQPTLTDDKSRFTPAGRLIDRQVETSTANPPTNSYPWIYRYDASGNLTNASGGGQTYTLAYDEDNRTTSVAWDNGMTAKTIANRYDALGRRISRSLDGATTGYVLSLVGGMERILCEVNPDSTFTYYVHGPDLAYKEAADGTVTYFHADAQANIVSLTAANAATVAQYAYTPYGRSLGSTSTLPALNSQPFNFVGSQGVMEELPGLYFMRARYYSADAGVFLSTDPVKNIGAGWKPEAYGYAGSNPLSASDPDGNEPITAAVAYNAWQFEQKFIKPINQLLQVGVAMTDVYAGISTETEAQAELDHLLANHTWEKMGLKASLDMAKIPNAGLIAGQFADKEKSSFGSTIANAVPTSQTGQAAFNFGRLIGNVAVGTVSRAFSGLFGSSGSASTSTATGAANQASLRNSVQSVAQNSPTSGTSGTTSSGGGSGSKITIPSGATLAGIAKANGTTVSALLAANPQISNANVIHAGASLSLPRSNPPPGPQNGGTTKGNTASGSGSKGGSAKGGGGKK